MKRYLIVPLLLLSFMVACSTKVPELNNSDNGIIAFPLEASDETGKGFGYYYKVFSTLDPKLEITIYPRAGQDFVFSKELPAGKYYFDKYKLIFDARRTKSISKIHTREESLPRSIIVNVEPGTATIAAEKLVVKVFYEKQVNRSLLQKHNFRKLSDGEIKLLIEKFQSLENSSQWELADVN